MWFLQRPSTAKPKPSYIQRGCHQRAADAAPAMRIDYAHAKHAAVPHRRTRLGQDVAPAHHSFAVHCYELRNAIGDVLQHELAHFRGRRCFEKWTILAIAALTRPGSRPP